MLELTGACCNGIKAIEFMESIPDAINKDAKTKEFCECFERALNRFRYEISKSIPVETHKIKRIHGSGYIETCGHCGNAGAGAPSAKYCPNCGRGIKR